MPGPLEDVRVLELATWVAAPSAGAIMADLGADVVKLEPPAGDAWRASGGPAPGGRWSSVFELDNRGKRSVIVDLEQWEGPALVRRLCRGVDVFITNLTAARQERYELTAAAVHAEAPATVHASMTAYGLEGPDCERAGFDNAAFWARTGIMGIVGQPDCPPGMFRGGEGDHTAGLALLSAVLAALHERDRTGRGGVVDASLFAAGMWTIGSDYSRTLFTRRQPEFRDRRRPANPLANTYRCGDGRWLALVMPQSDRYWPGFCRGVGHQEWEHDPCYASLAARREHTEALTAAIDAELATCPRADWATRFDGAGLIWSPSSNSQRCSTILRRRRRSASLSSSVRTVHGSRRLPCRSACRVRRSARAGPHQISEDTHTRCCSSTASTARRSPRSQCRGYSGSCDAVPAAAMEIADQGVGPRSASTRGRKERANRE